MAEPLALEVQNVDKFFPGTQALSCMNFQLKKGEIHALVGENGAGKSTLMNIIYGIHKKDAGTIFIEGQEVEIKDPLDAQRCGIGFVHQEIALCPDVTVAENLYMASINTSTKTFMNYKGLYQKAGEALKELHYIKPDLKVGDLDISSQQVVEIAKALTLDCKVLILDEPTAVLTETETESLFRIMQKLKSMGISIIYISHRMAEIFGQCDRVTILRDGCYVDTLEVAQTDAREVVNKMVGREIGEIYPPKLDDDPEQTEVLLEVRGLSDDDRYRDISFKLHRGEILGLSGLVGSGRSESVQGLCGLHPRNRGEVLFKGQPLTIRRYGDAINQGIVYLTEDRKAAGVFLDMSIDANIAVMNLEEVSSRGLVNRKKATNISRELVEKLRVKFSSLSQLVSSLSGGNQQKVLTAKLLSINPAIIIMDEPTRGVDVGAKVEIHRLIRDLAGQGIGIIMISSELPEIIGMCDRVLVMHEGRQCGIVKGAEITEKRIIHLASGIC
jgi:ribose transport system ATP-binding protein